MSELPIGPVHSQTDRRHTRMVDRLVIHGEPLDFRELCRAAVPKHTRFLVFDLDRTFHLGRNMGELLGWEIIALQAYGPSYLEMPEGRRPPGRFFFDWSHPFALLKYAWLGVQNWAYPGLYYLFWGKLASKTPWTRLRSFLRYGPEAVRTVQQVPQKALMSQMAALPLDTLRTLAGRVWRRHRPDQVIDSRDIAWLRTHCKDVTIIISSASPQPVLEAAAEDLGADEILYSAIEEREGYLSAPHGGHRLLVGSRRPRRISPASLLTINSGMAKIEGLVDKHPEITDPDVCTVGITDTGYGEDHCWSQFLTRVVDINSTSPFPPIVSAGSPLQEVHSASALTQGEREQREAGRPNYLDPRRRSAAVHRGPVVFDGEVLISQLGTHLDSAEALSAACANQHESLGDARRGLSRQLGHLRERLEEAIAGFNSSSGAARRRSMAELKHCLRAHSSAQRRLARLERPLSKLTFELAELLASSRAYLEA